MISQWLRRQSIDKKQLNENQRRRREKSQRKRFDAESQTSLMIETKSKQWEKLISSRKIDKKNETIAFIIYSTVSWQKKMIFIFYLLRCLSKIFSLWLFRDFAFSFITFLLFLIIDATSRFNRRSRSFRTDRHSRS